MRPILTIGLDSAGRPIINGPLHDKILCYGLLEAARDMVHDFTPEKQTAQIIAASEADLPSESLVCP